jgi:ribonuclease P protein component
MGKFIFQKEERLSKEKQIQELFDKGSSFYLFPFKVLFLPQADPASPVHQVLISVSKRNFKRAVDRNLIKRRVREAYRLQHQQFLPEAPRLSVALIYTHKQPLLSAELQGKMRQTLVKLGKMALSPS